MPDQKPDPSQKVYEQGIMNGETAADVKMMTINQERFEDPPISDPQKR